MGANSAEAATIGTAAEGELVGEEQHAPASIAGEGNHAELERF